MATPCAAPRQTSGPVEGINNKARVIGKRSYGLKFADSLWMRLVLHVNRAGDIVCYSPARPARDPIV